MVRAHAAALYNPSAHTVAPHTYLDGTSPFTYQGSWAVGASHSTATMSSGGPCGLYGLRVMHRPNIFLSRFGPRAGRAFFYVGTLS
ncbi:hypothetical protein BV20DRAFT_951718 [Pilatotrama ljubarskyi]|nr:hypothetical protein BV20DRAFT_951718 [Pilatotrama ljubarskyi]